MTKPKLLIATDSFLPRWDGIARFLDEIIPHLSKHFDITIACPDYGRPPTYPARIVLFPLRKVSVAGYAPAQVDKKTLQNLIDNADVVFTQTIGPIGYYAIKYARKKKKYVVSFIHSIEWALFSKNLPVAQRIAAWILKKIIPRIYNKSDLLICPSNETLRAIQQKGIGKKHVVIPLGVDNRTFRPRKNAKKELGLEDYTVIGYVGRTTREKDLDTLYKAFRQLYEEDKTIHLLIVGGEVSWQDMRGITNIPQVNNPQKYFQAMDIYVLPSHTETTSLTTLEAMASQLPVVVTPMGHINVYLKDRKNGMLFPPGDVDYLKSLLQELIASPALRARLGRAARKTSKEYSWKKTADELVQVLKPSN
ncbi:glycosyltransferase family 1 protein [Candidatus Woesearchaeota archaeon]|nr:MAG: glycosyltransferase family 1 protein [Candidatus Woesearchaeota archaeon]